MISWKGMRNNVNTFNVHRQLKVVQQQKAQVESELQKLKADTSSRDKVQAATVQQRDQLERYEKKWSNDW